VQPCRHSSHLAQQQLLLLHQHNFASELLYRLLIQYFTCRHSELCELLQKHENKRYAPRLCEDAPRHVLHVLYCMCFPYLSTCNRSTLALRPADADTLSTLAATKTSLSQNISAQQEAFGVCCWSDSLGWANRIFHRPVQ
jgi:hypothetical protein